MSRWTFKSPKKTLELYEANESDHGFIKEFGDLTEPWLSKNLSLFNREFENRDPHAFVNLVERVYPYWNSYVAHVESKEDKFFHESLTSSRLVGNARPSLNNSAQILNTFFNKSFGKSDNEVERWLKRIEAIIKASDYVGHISPGLYMSESSIEDVIELMDTRVYLWDGVSALDKGYSLAQVKKVNLAFVHIGYSAYDLDLLLEDYNYPQINKVAALFEKFNSIQPLNDYREMIGLYGKSKKEIWALARNSGLGYERDDAFYKLGEIIKNISDEELNTIAVHNPKPLESAPILVKISEII